MFYFKRKKTMTANSNKKMCVFLLNNSNRKKSILDLIIQLIINTSYAFFLIINNLK